MVETLNIKDLNVNELMGVINSYPWYGVARKEMCVRMSQMGAWSDAQYAEASLYIGSRKIVSDMVRSGRKEDYADSDVQALLKSVLEDSPEPQEAAIPEEPEIRDEEPRRQIFIIGGDYFSRSQYDNVRREGDGVFSSFAQKESNLEFEEYEPENSDFCTETLAQIYAEQGYPQEAKDIYSKLILRYPEKSAYFAALIENIDNK